MRSIMMRSMSGALAAAFVVLAGAVIGGAGDQAPLSSPEGAWAGRIEVPGSTLNVAVNLSRDAASGAWTGTIDVPSQGLKGARLSNIVVDGPSLSFAIAGIPGDPRFAGTLSDDRQAIAGTFMQGGGTLPFELRRGGITYVRPQEPKAPFPYRSDAVTYRNVAAGVSFAGTLTLPASARRHPAVLLISGSGAQDRDSTILGHRPFLVLADALTRRGVAVLRVDDRGVGGSDRGSSVSTSADLAGDVRGGLSYLASRPDIDPARIGLVGHSEGANIAAMVAADTTGVRFIVMLGGSGVRGDELMMQQAAALGAAQGLPKGAIDWDLGMRRRVYDQVLAERDGPPDAEARRRLLDSIPALPGAIDAAAARQTAELLLRASSGPWFRFFLSYDPRTALTRVKVPVLAVNGGRDLQVPAEQNVPGIRSALEAAGNPDATVRVLPELNHLLQTAKTGLVAEYEAIDETIAPAALSLIADWVTARVR